MKERQVNTYGLPLKRNYTIRLAQRFYRHIRFPARSERPTSHLNKAAEEHSRRKPEGDERPQKRGDAADEAGYW